MRSVNRRCATEHAVRLRIAMAWLPGGTRQKLWLPLVIPLVEGLNDRNGTETAGSASAGDREHRQHRVHRLHRLHRCRPGPRGEGLRKVRTVSSSRRLTVAGATWTAPRESYGRRTSYSSHSSHRRSRAPTTAWCQSARELRPAQRQLTLRRAAGIESASGPFCVGSKMPVRAPTPRDRCAPSADAGLLVDDLSPGSAHQRRHHSRSRAPMPWAT